MVIINEGTIQSHKGHLYLWMGVYSERTIIKRGWGRLNRFTNKVGWFYEGEGQFYEGEGQFYEGEGQFYEGEGQFYQKQFHKGGWGSVLLEVVS